MAMEVCGSPVGFSWKGWYCWGASEGSLGQTTAERLAKRVAGLVHCEKRHSQSVGQSAPLLHIPAGGVLGEQERRRQASTVAPRGRKVFIKEE
jgi:hypothetical protein